MESRVIITQEFFIVNLKISKKPDGFGKLIVTCSCRHQGKTMAVAGGVFAKGEDAKFIKHFTEKMYGSHQYTVGNVN